MLANWKMRGIFPRFLRAYLEGKAGELATSRQWDAFGDVLALIIYGLILFPTYEDFIDFVAVSIFWVVLKEKENPVLALMDDILHALHLLHKNRNGTLVCYLPLLYTWLTSHVFKADAWINDMASEEWA